MANKRKLKRSQVRPPPGHLLKNFEISIHGSLVLKVTAARLCHRQKTEGLYKKSFDNAGEYLERKEKRIKAKLDKSSADEVEAKRVKL